MYGLGGVCGSGECVVWVEVGKSFMWCVVWEGEEGVCGDEFGTYRPPKNDTLTRRAVQQAMAGVGGIFWGAYRYHISLGELGGACSPCASPARRALDAPAPGAQLIPGEKIMTVSPHAEKMVAEAGLHKFRGC